MDIIKKPILKPANLVYILVNIVFRQCSAQNADLNQKKELLLRLVTVYMGNTINRGLKTNFVQLVQNLVIDVYQLPIACLVKMDLLWMEKTVFLAMILWDLIVIGVWELFVYHVG